MRISPVFLCLYARICLIVALCTHHTFEGGSLVDSGALGVDVVLDGNAVVTTGDGHDNTDGLTVTGAAGSCGRLGTADFGLNGASAFTVAAWIKVTAGTGDDRIISKSTGTAEGDHAFMLSLTGGTTLRGRLKVGDTTSTVVGNAGKLPAQVWKHVAMTFDGTNIRLYVDGVQDVEMSRPGTLTVGNEGVAIGCNPTNDCCNIGAIIDDVYVCDEVLDIAALAGAGTTNAATTTEAAAATTDGQGMESTTAAAATEGTTAGDPATTNDAADTTQPSNNGGDTTAPSTNGGGTTAAGINDPDEDEGLPLWMLALIGAGIGFGAFLIVAIIACVLCGGGKGGGGGSGGSAGRGASHSNVPMSTMPPSNRRYSHGGSSTHRSRRSRNMGLSSSNMYGAGPLSGAGAPSRPMPPPPRALGQYGAVPE